MTSELRISLAMLALAVALYFVSATPDNQSAFVFPRMLALILVAIAAASVGYAWHRSDRKADAARVRIPWRAIWPALLVFVFAVNAAEQLGFYVTCLIAFVSLAAIYSSPDRLLPGIAKICVIAVAFIGVLYILFSLILRVQMPPGVVM